MTEKTKTIFTIVNQEKLYVIFVLNFNSPPFYLPLNYRQGSLITRWILVRKLKLFDKESQKDPFGKNVYTIAKINILYTFIADFLHVT